MLSIGAVSYINAFPFFYGRQEALDVHFIFDHPSKINSLLDAGAVDVGLISSESYLSHKNEYVLLRGHGIGATREVMSVCLYAKIDKHELSKKTILIPNTSETSNQLLKVLCRHFWNVDPHFFSFDAVNEAVIPTHADAFVLIGDSCLTHLEIEGFQRTDLAREWYEAVHKPFIFAVFAANKRTYLQKKQEIDKFMQSIGTAHDGMNEVMKRAHAKTGLPEVVLKRYYQVIDYELTNAHYEGLNLFDQLRCSNTLKMSLAP